MSISPLSSSCAPAQPGLPGPNTAVAPVTANDVLRKDITHQELAELAERKSAEILQKIKETTERIAAAQQEAKKAKEMTAGGLGNIFGGKTRKKLTATANGLVATNAALATMNDLLQESIRFTCVSLQFAQVVNKTMSHMMASGFKDASGLVTRLSDDSKEFAQMILDETEDFVRKQMAVEAQQAELKARIDDTARVNEEQTERLNELAAQLEKKRQVDNAQEVAIQQLIARLKQKAELDTRQDDLIQQLVVSVKQIAAIHYMPIVLSAVAILLAIAALGMALSCN